MEKGQSVIFVNGKRFIQCKYLLLTVPLDKLTPINELKSMDEISDVLDPSLELIQRRIQGEKIISPETEFWGHCSNLQVWYENNYNTNLLHSHLAFPLLKALTDTGDLKAQKVFSEEIAKRIDSGYLPVVLYLLEQRYILYLTPEQIDSLKFFSAFNYKIANKNDQDNLRLDGLKQHVNNITPKNANEWIAKAEFYRAFNDLDIMFSTYEQGIKLFPDNELLFYYYLINILKAQQYPKGILLAKNRIQKNPQNFELWNILGTFYHKFNDLKEAEHSFKKCEQISPDNPLSKLNLARVYKDQGLRQQSIVVLKKLYNSKINDKLILENMFEICDEMSLRGLQLKILRKMLLINPEASETWYALSVIYEKKKKISHQRKCLKKAITFDNDPQITSMALHVLAKLYLDKNDIDKSLELFELAVQKNPDNVLIWYNLCPLYVGKYNVERAYLAGEIAFWLEQKSTKKKKEELVELTKYIETLREEFFSLKYKCIHCKKELDRRIDYCVYCGKKLGITKKDIKESISSCIIDEDEDIYFETMVLNALSIQEWNNLAHILYKCNIKNLIDIELIIVTLEALEENGKIISKTDRRIPMWKLNSIFGETRNKIY